MHQIWCKARPDIVIFWGGLSEIFESLFPLIILLQIVCGALGSAFHVGYSVSLGLGLEG